MLDTKTLKLIRYFKPNELEEIRQFLKSSYFNNSKKALQLYNFILKDYPHFSPRYLTYEAAFEFVYPQIEPPADLQRVIGKLSSKLHGLLLQYIEVASLKSDPFTAIAFRKDWYRQKGEVGWEAEAIKLMEASNEGAPYTDEIKLYRNYLIEFDKLKLNNTAGTQFDKLDFNTQNQQLDIYYIRVKLESLCHQANQALVSQQQVNMASDLEAIHLLIGNLSNPLPDLCRLWYLALDLLLHPESAKAYNQFKVELLQGLEQVKPVEKRTFFHFLANCARYSFDTPQLYSKELLDLYQIQKNEEILLLNGFISPEIFYNIIVTALFLHETNWANVFFQEYKNHLNVRNEKRDEVISLVESLLHFENGKFGQALDCLNQSTFKDINSKLSERRLRLKIYIEMGMEALFYDHVNAFRKFLSVNNEQIALHHLEGSRAFINYAMAIFRGQKEKSREPLKALFDEVSTCRILPDRNWLLGKITHLLSPPKIRGMGSGSKTSK